MKNRLKYSCLLLFAMTFFTQCTKNKIDFDAYYCTSYAEGVKVYIDGEEIGTATDFQTTPTCDNDSLLEMMLYQKLKSGKHTYKAIDENEEVIAKGSFKIKRNKLSHTGKKGGMRIDKVDECVIFTISDTSAN